MLAACTSRACVKSHGARDMGSTAWSGVWVNGGKKADLMWEARWGRQEEGVADHALRDEIRLACTHRACQLDGHASTTRAEDAQGTPTQSHVSPSILVYEEKR